MSLVGTRPPTVDEWEQYELHHRNKLEEQLLKKLNDTEGRSAAVSEIDQKIQQLELRKKKIMEEISDSTISMG